MTVSEHNIVLISSTRADWGILSPLARALASHPSVNLTVVAANMHLMPQYGNTVDEIRADGFHDVVCIPAPPNDRSVAARTAIASSLANGLAQLFERIHPSAAIILGDRYEMLGAATAALIAGVPIVHLHGGEISEGAIDDSVRHAISKMATMHLVATPQARERLLAMAEEERRIIITGAIGVENTLKIIPMPIAQLRDELDGFDISPDKTLLVTFHPVTRHPEGIPTLIQFENILTAIDSEKRCNAIITFPNNDPGSEVIIRRLEDFAAANPKRVKLVRSLGRRRYLSAMHNVRAVVGNTSSGILEAPSTQADTIDIGPRQHGRDRALSVVHVDDDVQCIRRAIAALFDNPRIEHSPFDNPYYRPDSILTAVNAIVDILPSLPLSKKFQIRHN